MTSEEYGQYIDDFELGADVMPGESLTEYIERRRRDFESKADGGSIGIEVFFGPKREDFRIGGRARPTDRVYDSRANVEDFTKALKSVSAGTTYQQQADAQRYARNKANEMLTAAMRSGNQSGIQSIFQGVGGPTSMGGMQFNRSGNRITSIPATGPGRDKIINAMAQQMLNTTPSYRSIQPRDNLGLLMQDTIITDQMRSPAEMEAIRQKVLAAQKAQEQSYFMTDPVTGKKYSSEAEAIDDLGIVTYNQRFADGGRVPMVSGGFLKGIGKGIMELLESGANKKMFRSADDIPPMTISKAKGPMTIEMMEAVDPSIVKKLLRTQELGLYEETPEILKAANLLERFTKKVKGKRVIDYERAEAILGVPLKGDETINELFKIEFETIPVEKMADGGRVGLFMGGPPLTGQPLSIYTSMNAYGFSDQEIANAIKEAGYELPTSTSTASETTAPNIIGSQINQGDDKGPASPRTKFDKGFSLQNFNLGPKKDVVDYEAEAYGIGPTFKGQFAKALTAFSKIPTPFNIARMGIQKAVDFANKGRERDRIAREKAAAELKAKQAIAAAEKKAREQNILNQAYQQQTKTQKEAGGGGGGQFDGATSKAEYDRNPTGFSGSFNRGGLATMFTRRR